MATPRSWIWLRDFRKACRSGRRNQRACREIRKGPGPRSGFRSGLHRSRRQGPSFFLVGKGFSGSQRVVGLDEVGTSLRVPPLRPPLCRSPSAHGIATMKIDNFFAELKRRNVYKVAVAYLVVSWLLIQAASILFPTFDAPPWIMKIFIIVIIFGFPVALIFSWAFEITPEGIKLESEIEPSKSIKRRTGRKIVAVTIALAVIAVGLFVYQLVQPKVGTALLDVRSDSAKDEGRLGQPSLPAPNKSVAVLPFVNR